VSVTSAHVRSRLLRPPQSRVVVARMWHGLAAGERNFVGRLARSAFAACPAEDPTARGLMSNAVEMPGRRSHEGLTTVRGEGSYWSRRACAHRRRAGRVFKCWVLTAHGAGAPLHRPARPSQDGFARTCAGVRAPAFGSDKSTPPGVPDGDNLDDKIPRTHPACPETGPSPRCRGGDRRLG
jgi:hypothetical protein